MSTAAAGAPRLTRREFVITSLAGGGGLFLAITSVSCREPTAPFVPNGWLRIDSDGGVTITIAKSEMGQGVWTTLPLLVAEELEADWSRVRVQQADGRPGDGYQATGGSGSVTESWELLRRAGAVAREMLITAAATMWGKDVAECEARTGWITHRPSGRRVSYGDLTVRAASLPVLDPAAVALKSAADFRLIGSRVSRLDGPDKTRGRATFGIDVRVPGMLYAVVARCPVFGGTLGAHDLQRASAIAGVRHVVRLEAVGAPIHLPQRIAVVGTSTWAALEGRRALTLEWDGGANAELSSDAIADRFTAAVNREGRVVVDEGESTFLGAQPVALTAEYRLPYLAHQTMEPPNATARVTPAGIEIWAPTQHPPHALRHLARLTGVPAEAITLHVTFMGGGFGRRLNADFVVEAVEISEAVGAPVQVLWTRDDDLQHDFYRPASWHRIRAARVDVDGDGPALVWLHRLVAPSTSRFFNPNHERPEEQELWGSEPPYRTVARRIVHSAVETPVPVGWWRSVGNSQNTFVIESAINELADIYGADHVSFRHDLLGEHPRLRRVLAVAAERGSWSSALPPGSGRGVALCKAGDTFVAQIVEARVSPRNEVTVQRVVCAIDCGIVVNPSSLEAQVEGSIVWGLSAALTGEITVARGRVVQSSFADAPVMRLRESPRIEVYVIPSREPPSGAGEPAVTPVAAALVDAVHAAVGLRARNLPLTPAALERLAGGPSRASPS